MKSIIINSSPIICLSYIDSLHLIYELFKQIDEEFVLFVPKSVVEELKDPITQKAFINMVKEKKILVWEGELEKEQVLQIAAEIGMNSKNSRSEGALG